MRFNLGVVEISDEQRVQLANVLDNKVSTRLASRNEAREFALTHGARWVEQLDHFYQYLVENDEFDEDDLL